MAKEPHELEKGDSIPENDTVFRIVHNSFRDKQNKMEPSIKAFSLNPIDKGKLSVDYEKLTNPEHSIARFGATYKHNTEKFKNHKDFEIYAIKVEFLLALANSVVGQVVLDPINNEPCIIGTPNNPSHTLVHFHFSEEDEPQVYIEIRNHAKDNLIPYDEATTLGIIEKLRKCESL